MSVCMRVCAYLRGYEDILYGMRIWTSVYAYVSVYERISEGMMVYNRVYENITGHKLN